MQTITIVFLGFLGIANAGLLTGPTVLTAAQPAAVVLSNPPVVVGAVPIVKTVGVPTALVHTHSYSAPVVRAVPAPVYLNRVPAPVLLNSGPIVRAIPVTPVFVNAPPAPTIVRTHTVVV